MRGGILAALLMCAAPLAAGPSPTNTVAPSPDLAKLSVPILAIQRLVRHAAREDAAALARGKNLSERDPAGETHLTAIALGVPMTPQYADAMRRFIEAFDEP